MAQYTMHLYMYSEGDGYEYHESDSLEYLMNYAQDNSAWYAQAFDEHTTLAEWTGTHWDWWELDESEAE